MEALDLGATLCQSAARSTYTCYLTVAVPVIAVALASFELASWLPIVLIWWLKPWLDRTILFVLSRAAFGQKTSLGTLWDSQFEVWWRQLFLTLTWRRLSPWRTLTQPVYQLEGLEFGRYGKRLSQIRHHQMGTGALLTSAFALVDQAMVATLIGLTWLFTPGDVSFADLYFSEDSVSTTFSFTIAVGYGMAVAFLEPFYVGAGFALYLNRRVELEAWDIEQEFRRAFAR